MISPRSRRISNASRSSTGRTRCRAVGRSSRWPGTLTGGDTLIRARQKARASRSRLLFVETAAFGMFRRMSLLLPLSFSRPCGERGSADRARGGVQGAREPDGDELVVVRLAGGAAGGEREVVVFFLVRAASPWAPSRSM